MKAITESTVVPISMVISLVGGIYFVSGLSHRLDAAEGRESESRQEMKRSQEEYLKNLIELKESLAEIKGKLGITKK